LISSAVQAADNYHSLKLPWEQIKTGYAAGVGLREIARKMDIPSGTVLAHAKRHGWTQQIQIARQQQSDAITSVQPVPESIAAILSERKDRTKLGLSKYAAEAAEQAAEHRDKLEIARKVKDVASVHSNAVAGETGCSDTHLEPCSAYRKSKSAGRLKRKNA